MNYVLDDIDAGKYHTQNNTNHLKTNHLHTLSHRYENNKQWEYIH